MQSVSILIVEDEIIVAMDLSARLTRMGFKIVGKAVSAEQAVAIFEREKPDLVLMDVNLRGAADGVDAAEKILSIQPTPIIFLTAQTDDLTFSRAKHTRPAAYLTKPFDEKNLQLSIELALHNFAVQKSPTPSVSDAEKDAAATARKSDRSLTADNILKMENGIFIKQNYRFIKFQPDELLFLQADGVYTDLITKQHKYTLRLTLTQALERMNMAQLVRVHRSYAVNIRNVEEFNDAEITIGKNTIPIGASFREAFLRNFDFM